MQNVQGTSAPLPWAGASKHGLRWDKLVVSVCMQLDAQQFLQGRVQLSPYCRRTALPAVVVLCVQLPWTWRGKHFCLGRLCFAATEQQLLRCVLCGDLIRQAKNKVNLKGEVGGEGRPHLVKSQLEKTGQDETQILQISLVCHLACLKPKRGQTCLSATEGTNSAIEYAELGSSRVLTLPAPGRPTWGLYQLCLPWHLALIFVMVERAGASVNPHLTASLKQLPEKG